MKKNSHKISKKNMPDDLRRVTNRSGKRVWVTGGKEYESLVQIAMALRIRP